MGIIKEIGIKLNNRREKVKKANAAYAAKDPYDPYSALPEVSSKSIDKFNEGVRAFSKRAKARKNVTKNLESMSESEAILHFKNSMMSPTPSAMRKKKKEYLRKLKAQVPHKYRNN